MSIVDKPVNFESLNQIITGEHPELSEAYSAFYVEAIFPGLKPPRGIEPRTRCLQDSRSTKLSYDGLT